MPLNPTLKNVLIRTAYIVGSVLLFVVLGFSMPYIEEKVLDMPPLQPLFWAWLALLAFVAVWINIYKLERPLQLFAVAGGWVAYIVIYYCLDKWTLHFGDDGFVDEHPTVRTTLLMIASASLIWINIRKLPNSIQRIYFSIFLLILTVLIGAWKVGVFYYNQSFLLKDLYLAIFPCLGLMFVVTASLLPIFFAKWRIKRHSRSSKAGLLVAVLLFDFTIAMPNVFGDETLETRIYSNKHCYLIRENSVCRLLSTTNPNEEIWRDSIEISTIAYYSRADSWWVALNGDSIRMEHVAQAPFQLIHITHSNGKDYHVSSLGCDYTGYGNCWQYNAWYKFKRLFRKKENE